MSGLHADPQSFFSCELAFTNLPVLRSVVARERLPACEQQGGRNIVGSESDLNPAVEHTADRHRVGTKFVKSEGRSVGIKERRRHRDDEAKLLDAFELAVGCLGQVESATSHVAQRNFAVDRPKQTRPSVATGGQVSADLVSAPISRKSKCYDRLNVES
ncbi:hypothetical protein H8A99_21575 [Bradyrhizobium sp. Arg68]|uniref:hypothetical protein n=1 Tax=Bradyrhizobium ivorense TaxID=2511166 RepID=UPI001E5ED745|nr:hypothetical protein [Bradyrhizobium ivorense]MCC8938994.1 hypothetical protein [Bradyrhizobium ivorense]